MFASLQQQSLVNVLKGLREILMAEFAIDSTNVNISAAISALDAAIIFACTEQ